MTRALLLAAGHAAVDHQRLGDQVEHPHVRAEAAVGILRTRAGRDAGTPSGRRPRATPMSVPSNSTRPPAVGTSRSTARPSVVLPLPDSPTTARFSPRSRVSDTSRTARTGVVREEPAPDEEVDRDTPSSRQQLGSWRRRDAALRPARRSDRQPAAGRVARRTPPRSGGGSTHRSKTTGQRAANRQPAGGVRRSGGVPGQEPGRRVAVEPRDARQQPLGVGVARRRPGRPRPTPSSRSWPA